VNAQRDRKADQRSMSRAIELRRIVGPDPVDGIAFGAPRFDRRGITALVAMNA